MTAQTVKIETLSASQLLQAYEGSYYTIAGTGGDLNEWVEGYHQLLEESGIRRPKAWFQTNGLAVNTFAMRESHFIRPDDLFRSDLTFLMFSLDEISAGGKLALFKLRMSDQWFDDMINNMRRRAI